MIGPHLCGDEHVLASDAGRTHALADLALILINLGRIDMAIPDFERLLDDAGAGASAQLPRAEPDRWDFCAVGLDKQHGQKLLKFGTSLCPAAAALPTHQLAEIRSLNQA
jgi:hypothetical protein